MTAKIPKGWKKVKLGELAKIKNGKSNTQDAVEDGLYPFFDRSKQIKRSNKFLFDTTAIIIPGEGKEFIPKFFSGKFDLHQRAYAIFDFSDNVNPKYIYYYILFSNQYFKSVAVGSTVMSLRLNHFIEFPILLPPLPEQKAIAAVLSSLDDKIDLLHRQNKTLEAMAEALFREWFIEEAKEDWEYNALGNYVRVYKGVSYKSSELNSSNIALVTLKNFGRDGSLRFDGFKEYTGKYKEEQIVKSGDLVIAQTDITQNADIIGNPLLIFNLLGYEKLVISMDVVKIEPKNEWLSKEFLYYLMRTKSFKEHCIGFSNGSTVLHLSKDAIPNFEFFVPPKEKVVLFTEKVKKIIEKIHVNLTQIRTLEKLRDTLLPKLMSGEVRVKR